MISMDTNLLTGAIEDSRARHEEYARRFGSVSIVLCNSRPRPLPSVNGERLSIEPTNSPRRLLYIADGIRTGLRVASRKHPTVITSQDPFLTGLVGLYLRWVLGVPLIVQDHTSVVSSGEWGAESRLNRILLAIAQWVLPRADAVRVVNRAEAEACIKLGVPQEKLHVIPVATDLQRFTTPDARIDWRARLGVSPDDLLCLWVGRPVPFKNLKLLIHAFQTVKTQNPQAKLVIAGDLAQTEYPSLIADLGLENVIKLAGRVPHDDLPGLYQTANLYTHSSHYEGTPRVFIEAAAAGLPILSTPIAAAYDLITHGETGFIVDGVREVYAQTLREALRDPARLQTMGNRLQKDVLTRFDSDRIMEEWVNLWRRVGRV